MAKFDNDIFILIYSGLGGSKNSTDKCELRHCLSFLSLIIQVLLEEAQTLQTSLSYDIV